MNLFPRAAHVSSDPKANGESSFEFFTRGADWPDMVAARERMELWFTHLPHEKQTRIGRSMAQGTDEQFDAFFFELLLHEFILASGYTPEMEPLLGGRRAVLDFGVHSAAGRILLMEATVVTDKPDAERREERVQGEVLDMLNTLPAPHHSFAVRELTLKSSKRPSLRSIKDFVTQRMATMPSMQQIPADVVWDYEDADVRVRLTPIYHREKTWKTNVGMGPTKSRWGGAENAIVAKLAKKASQCAGVREPLVVAVNVLSPWSDALIAVTGALLGACGESCGEARSKSAVPGRLGADAFWSKNGVPQHTTISAVLATQVFPWSALRAPLRIYHNPYARYPLPESVFGVDQVTRDLVVKAGVSLGAILERGGPGAEDVR